jgi:hypothetical protein
MASRFRRLLCPTKSVAGFRSGMLRSLAPGLPGSAAKFKRIQKVGKGETVSAFLWSGWPAESMRPAFRWPLSRFPR